LAEAASFFRIPLVDTRRTEKEISVIIEIFSRCRELLDEQGINTQEELLEFQYADADYIDFDRYSFDREFLKSIPQNPGVYIMKNANEEVVYVGKAKNLKTRVSSYFWNTPDRPQKTAELLNTVYSIDYEIVGSELAALLLEFKLIKQHQPKMNLQTEVHERTARYGSVRNFILIAPAVMENCLELFFVKEGLPVQRYEILKDAVNFSEVEKILSGRYYADTKIEGQPPLCSEDNNNIPQCNEITDIEAGERDIILSWVETNKDRVNYINVDLVSGREACLKLIKDYVKEKDTLYEKQYRWL
jgi:hypothetical protein